MSEQDFSTFASKVAGTLKDFSSIDVATYSGRMKVNVEANKADLENVFKTLSNAQKQKVEGELELIAATRISFDKDATTIVKPELTAEQLESIKAHAELIKAAQDARMAVLNFVRGLLKL